MGSVKTTADIITSVKRRAMIPTDNSTFSNTDFLEILSEELMLNLVPELLKVHEEFYVYPDEQTITGGDSTYVVPDRAVASKPRNVRLKDGSGNYIQMTRIQPEAAAEYSHSSHAFYFRRDEVVLVGSPSGTLVIDIFLRPNQLVETSRGATVSSVDTSTGIVTFTDELPSHFTSTGTYDFVKKSAPCKIMAFDKTSSVIDTSGYTLTFTAADLPSGLAAGDYVTFAEETIVPQLPVELVPLLEQMAACHCLEAIGDMESLSMAERKLEKMKTNSGILIDNRSEGTPQKVTNRNSLLSGRKTTKFR